MQSGRVYSSPRHRQACSVGSGNTRRYRSSPSFTPARVPPRLHPRFRSVQSPPMPSYFGPGRLAVFSAAAYSVPQPSLTSIPLRSIPVRPGFTTLALLRVPQDSRTVFRPQRCSLRSPVIKEFTRLPRRPSAQSLYNEHINDSKIKAVSNSLPPSHTAGPASLQPPDSRHLRNIIRP